MRFLKIIGTLIIIIVSSFSTGCNKELPCSEGQLQALFIKYQASDIDTFIIRKLKPNGNFSIIDTQIAINKFNISQILKGDTTINYIVPIVFTQDFDWQVFIPATNQLFTISDIESEKKTQKVGSFARDVACQNKIFAYKLNGIRITTNPTNEIYESFPFYMHK